jgi:hypothetical protein
MNTLSKELCNFMIWIVDFRFAHHIMSKHRGPLSAFVIVDGRFAPIASMNMHRSLPSQPIGNKESKNQPIVRTRHI